MHKNYSRILFTALLAAWAFDFLFWHKTPGLSFLLYVIVLLAVGFGLAYGESKPPARTSLWLLAPILVLAFSTSARLEPVTVFTNTCLTLALLMLLVHTFRGGRWTDYSLSDLALLGLRLLESAIVLGGSNYQQIKKERASETESDQIPTTRLPTRQLLAVVRGLLLALPVVIVFGALLASADPVFGEQIERFLELFSLDKLLEYTWRGIYILFLAYFLLGLYLHALTKSRQEKLIGLEKPPVRPFLGALEAGIVLSSVNALFLAFVIVQFQYFFGGQVNINYAGLTYAEYARRGFGELIFVACASLLLFLSLSTLTRREAPLERKVYSALGVSLGLLVGVILISAFQRLLLYESAFGFTRLRTYPHICMVWLGFLLLAFVLLEIISRQRLFAQALLLACLGFGLSLSAINVDGLITRQNFQRARAGDELDLDYLLTLSVDSTPELVAIFESDHISVELHDNAGVLLACQAAKLSTETKDHTWTGFHFSRWRAMRLLDAYQEALQTYPLVRSGTANNVLLNGEEINCAGKWWLD